MFDIKKLTDRQIDQIHEFPADSGNYFIGWDDHQAELDAQQANIDGLKETIGQMAADAVRTNTGYMRACAKLEADNERLKLELHDEGVRLDEARKVRDNYLKQLAETQVDLAAHALALKEAREVTTLADYVIRELGDGNFDEDSHEAAVLSIHKNTIKAFLARPLSSYQQRAERLEAVAKAAAGHDEDALETALAILEGRGENCAE